MELAVEGATQFWRPLLLFATLAGLLSALVTGPVFHQLPPALLDMGRTSEDELRAALGDAASLFWPFIFVHLLALLAQSALIVPWARLTSAFGLLPLGQHRHETLVRIVRVFIRQLSMLFVWLALVVLVMLLSSAILPLLPPGLKELAFVALMLFLILSLLVFASYLHTIIIAESCFGKVTVPAMLKATGLMIRPLVVSLLLIAAVTLVISTLLEAFIASPMPEGVDLTVKLVISGAMNFLVSAIHICAINRLPVWTKAAGTGE